MLMDNAYDFKLKGFPRRSGKRLCRYNSSAIRLPAKSPSMRVCTLERKEMRTSVKKTNFTIHNIQGLQKKGNIFMDVLSNNIALKNNRVGAKLLTS